MNPAKVLIVDDDKKLAVMFRMALEGEGVSADVAESGEQAIEKVKGTRYDVIFMDVIMPGLNGVQALEKIREIDKKVEIVMITGYAVNEMLERARQFGAYASLNKPISIDSLMRVIDRVTVDRTGMAVRKRCLVIDEKNIADTAVYALLEDLKYEIKICNQCVEMVKEDLLQYDLLILNVDINKRRCEESLRAMLEKVPREQVIVLVDTSEEEAAIEGAFRYGVKKYLHRAAGADEIRSVLKKQLKLE